MHCGPRYRQASSGVVVSLQLLAADIIPTRWQSVLCALRPVLATLQRRCSTLGPVIHVSTECICSGVLAVSAQKQRIVYLNIHTDAVDEPR
jgi:hypothetical protein